MAAKLKEKAGDEFLVPIDAFPTFDDFVQDFWSSDEESNLKRMELKGIPGIKYNDYRILLKSDPIENAPVAYLSDLPEDLKKAIREAFFNMEKNDKAASDKFFRRPASGVGSGRSQGLRIDSGSH